MKALLEAGVHFGHQTRRWNPKMAKFIFGARSNIHIIDLQKTVKELKKASRFIREIAASGKSILFAGTKKQAQEAILAEAQRCGAFWVNQRWLGGTLTNFETIKRSIARLQELERMKADGLFKVLSKQEVGRLERERLRLTKAFSGIKEMTHLPGCLFIIDPVQELTAVREARKVGVPIVAVCDTNCDPDLIDYPIPGNDDAIRAVKLFCTMMADAVLEGKAEWQKQQAETVEPVAVSVGGEGSDVVSSADVAEGSAVVSEPSPVPPSPGPTR